ncbi:ATP-binding protein [Nocardia terpenica]|uniref:ATP-binding protein n=1 Tax=Nocardia terpenica TaxID=455432 RepID=UPI00189582B8|nr:ATP-binding protein [Nocardia terpenica]MBF6063842.1 ATP-binding protein [Nocardia terpenica]MBF6108506.1 ATP-binding protein [Nocardia terpenica]MBF6116052.1 ATP-binding protein [Nocardia terpenica]MBF6121023.1 ATP-binding protein [Nocardia terpenica]MBF6156705.1 ATP-binding protein [Nocardia terpenica]
MDIDVGTVEPDDHKYTMRISRLAIDKLGIKLYDRVSAVLAELIANSYDADATLVRVTLPWGVTLAGTVRAAEEPQYEIIVTDNGHGMTADEVNAHYLMVGSDRRLRTGSDLSRERRRPVMGRKGIGKLAAFGICRTIEVITAGSGSADRTPAGWPVSHIVMDLYDMLSDTESDYYPKPGARDGMFSDRRGTTVILRDFFRKRVNSGPELNRQLAARFGIERSDWRVEVHNGAVAGESFILSDLPIDVMEETRIDLAHRPVRVGRAQLPVTGWVAYSKQPYRDEAMAGVRIYARGKIVAQTRDFGVPAGFTGEFKLRSYLVGAIHVDWLDDDEDLVRSDRQDIMWNSPRGEALAAWGRELIREIGRMGERSLRRRVWEEFVERSCIYESLEAIAPGDRMFRDSVIDAARILVASKDRAALDDHGHVESIVRLALSLGPQRSLLATLKEIAEDTDPRLDMVVALFERARVAEIYSLGQIASERVAVVDRLRRLIDDRRSLERPFQELIERAPWLLAPEWTPLGMNESLKRVRASFERWYLQKFGATLVTTSIGSEKREPDFVLLHDSGELWIVEIKRMDYHLTDEEYNRAINYLYSLDTFLTENPRIGAQFPRRRLTFIVDHIDKLRPASRSSLDSDSRIDRRTWRELLDSTLRAHRDFLERVYEMRAVEDEEDGGVRAV